MDKERFIKRPTRQHLESIFSWCPKYEIKNILWSYEHENQGVLALFEGQHSIAYLYYRELSRFKVEIQFIEVNDNYKKRKVGTRFMGHALRYFTEKGYKLVNIHCVTEAGENHAKRLGFQEYSPNNSNDRIREADRYMFYSLLPSVRLKEYRKSDVLSFVVWSKSHSSYGTPDMCYDIPSDEVLPLVDFLNYDWYAGLMKDGELVSQPKKIKYLFNGGTDEIFGEYASYLTASDILKTVCHRTHVK